MASESHSEISPPRAGYRHIGLREEWGERVVTVAAVSLAVMVVALIAVLMGMA